jgi:hypothetical protein
MFYDITLWIITSLIIIILIHYLFNFFKDTLTTPKVKDLIQEPLMRYKDIENITNDTNNSINNKDTIGTTSIEEIIDKKDTTTNNESDMKSELKNFFNELRQQNSSNNFTNNFSEKLYSEIR